jgi:uncharacterized membrane protein
MPYWDLDKGAIAALVVFILSVFIDYLVEK